MTYEVRISETLRTAPPSNVVIPISMGPGALTGERLRVLIDELKGLGHNITVVVADSLNRHNSKNLKGDLESGDNYLEENEETLTGITKERWDDWIKGERKEEFKKKLALVEEISKPGTDVYKKLVRTAKQVLLRTPDEHALKYLREEYAVFLMFHEFDYLVYTKPITPGLAAIYKSFRDEKKPCYEFARVNTIEAANMADLGMFKQKRAQATLPLAVQMVIDQAETVLKSPQISVEHKRVFLDMMINLMAITIPEDATDSPRERTISVKGAGAK